MSAASGIARTRRALALQSPLFAAGQALTPAEIERSPRWSTLQHVPLHVSVRIPLRAIRLCDLQSLEAGLVLASDWPSTDELPLMVENVALSWCEFDGQQASMAVRLTHLN